MAGAPKAAKKAVRGRPFRRGDSRINRTKPGTGRPPDAFKAMCRELASGKPTQKAVAEILKDSAHPAFVGALKWATENGYGRPEQPVALSGGVTLEIVMRDEAAKDVKG